jgi:hypothetical protein
MSEISTAPTVPKWVNVFVRAILRSPLHRAMSHNTMLLTFTGRTSGTRYTIPVRYLEDRSTLTVFTDSGWWRNLRGGVPVELVLRGHKRAGTGQPILQDEAANATSLRAFLLARPGDAKYHGVRLDASNHPLTEDLERAARTSTMVDIELTS